MIDGPIIFWWGSDLRLLRDGQTTSRGLTPGEDPAPAILEMMDGAGAGGPVRIVYYPEKIETHVLDGARVRLRRGFGGRERLRRELSKDISALSAPDTAWSAAPPPGGDGLVICLELHSRLPELVEDLARAGWRVEGAWPLPLLVAAGPADDGHGSLSLVALAERTLVAWFGPAGEPGAEVHSGDGILASTLAALRGALARFEDGEPSSGWLAVEDGPQADALRQSAAGLGLTAITLPGLLGRVRLQAPGSPADFLAQPVWWAHRKWRGRIAAAAAISLAAAAAGQVWTIRTHRDQRQKEWTDRQTQRRRLREEETAGLARQNQIAQLAGELSHLYSAPPRQYELLMALARAAPDTVVLDSVTMQGTDFEIAGRMEDSSTPSAGQFSSYYRTLAAPGNSWTLGPEPSGTSVSRFTLAGRFHPPLPPTPTAAELADHTAEAVARWKSLLEEERARLPSAASFDRQMKQRDSRWILSSESSDRFAGGEVHRYALAYDRAPLDDWSDLVETIRGFCAQPGLTIDRLTLTATPEGAVVFLCAQLNLSVRLRP